MSDARADALRLFEEASELPDTSPQRADMLEAAARHAEAAGDEALCFQIQSALISAAIDAGEIRRALVAFAYCLATCDAKPEQFAEGQLHWRYKWILEWAPRFSEVSRPQLNELLDDMSRRYASAGYGKNAVAKLRARAALFLGDDADLAHYYEQWKLTPRDRMSDCYACDLDEEVTLLLHMGRDDDALRAARSMFQRGQRCSEVPNLTYARILPALLRAGLKEEAAVYHRRGYPMLKRLHKKLAGHVGQHLLYAAVAGELGRGLRILRETLKLAAGHSVAEPQLSFLLGGEVLLERVARTQESVHLALPVELGGDGKSQRQKTSAVAHAFAGRVDALLAQFDSRNGNTRMSTTAAQWRAFKERSL